MATHLTADAAASNHRDSIQTRKLLGPWTVTSLSHCSHEQQHD
jgi:hypothetical protein